MDITILPSRLCGTVAAIPSKSHIHRVLICAALADKPTTLHVSGTSADIEATIRCLTSLGADIHFENKTALQITPIAYGAASNPQLSCGESGSTSGSEAVRTAASTSKTLPEKGLSTGPGPGTSRPCAKPRSAMPVS